MNKAYNCRDYVVIKYLQIYRPFQFGCHFEQSAEQNEKKFNYYKINLFEENDDFIEENDDFIEENDAFFDWNSFRQYISSRKNINNFEIDYELIKKRMDFVPEGCEISFREELMRNRFHPKNIDKWVDWGHSDPTDFE
jgi:acyl-CoA hydrolase